MNYFRTAILLAALTALFLAIGFMIGGEQGMLIAFVAAAGMNLFAYWNSDKMVLRMYGAREVDARSAPEFHALVADLARRAELPMPRVYIVENDQPNAFATGRNPQNAAVAATTGLLRMLSREELAGVMAHELAHVRNRDTLIMTVTATLAGALGMLANFALFFSGRNNSNNPLGAIGTLLAVLIAPIAAALVQFAISRSREYAADRIGAAISGNPLSLASALEKIAYGASRIDNETAERNPATAHLFIINPLHAHKRDSLFSTHPATENRVAALRQLAAESGIAGYRPAAASAPRATPRATPRRGPWG